MVSQTTYTPLGVSSLG
ncbi:rCG27003 [Rattus norvegicus]|uniref:RCG27003 n=1 Tax=Rattus norvegicus TaxID=10116 RepID=A6HM68_RAT|nr:rCG27003 [Rattus norvegicus]